MRQAKLCVIGAGFHATTNIYPSIIKSGAQVVAIATRSISGATAALLAIGSNGTPYDDYHSMLQNEECDGVVVVAQPKAMYDIACECIKAGKNVFSDKPLGFDERQAKEIADLAKKHGVILMVGFMKRFAPAYVALKETIESGSLLAPRSFTASFLVDATKFCADEHEFITLASIHYVDMFHFLFGECAEVIGFKNNQDGGIIHYSISLKFKSGVVGSVYLSSSGPWSRERENITVSFDGGFITADGTHKLIVHQNNMSEGVPWEDMTEEDRVITVTDTPMSGGYRDLFIRGYVGEIVHFNHCCLTGETPRSSGYDNVGTMALCDSILNNLK